MCDNWIYTVRFEVKTGGHRTLFLRSSYVDDSCRQTRDIPRLLSLARHDHSKCHDADLLWVELKRDDVVLGEWKTFEQAEAAVNGKQAEE